MKVIFEKLLNDLSAQKVISEDKKVELLKEFEVKLKERDEAVFTKALETVDEDHSTKFEQIITKQDNEHSALLKNLVEKIDNKHTMKLKKFAQTMDEQYSKKLVDVVKKLKSKNINENLVNKVSDYFDAYLKEVTPEQTVVNEAKMNKLEGMFKRIKDLVMVNDEFVQTEIKEAIEDAKKQIDNKDKTINQMMLEKVQMVKDVKVQESSKLLESKTKDMTPKMKAYVGTFFKNADKNEIEERLDEAVKAFKQEESKLRVKLEAEADQKKKITNPVITEEKDVVTENKKVSENDDNMMNHWAKLVSKNSKIIQRG